MNIDIRFPKITATTESGKLQQMQSYMHQLVEQLNWALNTVESAQAGNATPAVVFLQRESATAQEAEDTFNSIKALIIKSADIVKAYETTIFSDFNGKYFADSDFGTYIKETNRKVEENSEDVTETFKMVETIDSRVEGVEDEVKTTNAYIKRGLLPNGEYGIEIGETSEDGVFRHYARITSEKLSFYDVNGNEVAYIGAGTDDKDDTKCLYITGKAVFQGDILFRGYKMDTSDGLAFTWIGG
jgi:hypothetical protein